MELLKGSTTNQALDFHGTRRAFATALARVGVNEQTAMVLTGHSDGKVHKRYVEAATMGTLPADAVPSASGGFRADLRGESESPQG